MTAQKNHTDLTIRLVFDDNWIELSLVHADASGRRSGTVASSLQISEAGGDRFNAAIDAVESMMLAHACAGIDVTDPRYIEGIRTCLQSCSDRL